MYTIIMKAQWAILVRPHGAAPLTLTREQGLRMALFLVTKGHKVTVK